MSQDSESYGDASSHRTEEMIEDLWGEVQSLRRHIGRLEDRIHSAELRLADLEQVPF